MRVRRHSSTRRVSAPRHALLNLLQLLSGEPTVAQLEAELKLNPVLVMHLMKLANSSGLALGPQGDDAARRDQRDRHEPDRALDAVAALRGRPQGRARRRSAAATRGDARALHGTGDRALARSGRDEADAAFLTGVFSFVDAVFGGSLENTLNVLTLSRPIQAAIEHHEGTLGALLVLSETLERGAWADVQRACEGLAPLDAGAAAELALNAAAWAGIADRSAEAEGLERIED